MSSREAVTELWYDHFSKYRLAYMGDTGNLSVSTTMKEDGSGVTALLRPYLYFTLPLECHSNVLCNKDF